MGPSRVRKGHETAGWHFISRPSPQQCKASDPAVRHAPFDASSASLSPRMQTYFPCCDDRRLPAPAVHCSLRCALFPDAAESRSQSIEKAACDRLLETLQCERAHGEADRADASSRPADRHLLHPSEPPDDLPASKPSRDHGRRNDDGHCLPGRPRVRPNPRCRSQQQLLTSSALLACPARPRPLTTVHPLRRAVSSASTSRRSTLRSGQTYVLRQ
jgi:hypothetical protein